MSKIIFIRHPQGHRSVRSWDVTLDHVLCWIQSYSEEGYCHKREIDGLMHFSSAVKPRAWVR